MTERVSYQRQRTPEFLAKDKGKAEWKMISQLPKPGNSRDLVLVLTNNAPPQ
jgi:hypothetical protein